MRHIFIAQPPKLPKHWIKIYVGRLQGLLALASQADRSEYLRTKNSWGKLKSWLASFSHEKCWYCEAKSIRASFDVDHFRPKLSVTVGRRKLKAHPGYYWLAYEWWNFRLSCQRCNRPEGRYGKRNEFPIRDEATRCSAYGGAWEHEQPRLLDPCCAENCRLLGHGINGEVFPTADLGTWEYERADYTINQLGLNAFNAPEERRGAWANLNFLIRYVGDNPDVRSALESHLSPDKEYSSFFRAAIGSHRDKDWIQELL